MSIEVLKSKDQSVTLVAFKPSQLRLHLELVRPTDPNPEQRREAFTRTIHDVRLAHPEAIALKNGPWAGWWPGKRPPQGNYHKAKTMRLECAFLDRLSAPQLDIPPHDPSKCPRGTRGIGASAGATVGLYRSIIGNLEGYWCDGKWKLPTMTTTMLAVQLTKVLVRCGKPATGLSVGNWREANLRSCVGALQDGRMVMGGGHTKSTLNFAENLVDLGVIDAAYDDGGKSFQLGYQIDPNNQWRLEGALDRRPCSSWFYVIPG